MIKVHHYLSLSSSITLDDSKTPYLDCFLLVINIILGCHRLRINAHSALMDLFLSIRTIVSYLQYQLLPSPYQLPTGTIPPYSLHLTPQAIYLPSITKNRAEFHPLLYYDHSSTNRNIQIPLILVGISSMQDLHRFGAFLHKSHRMDFQCTGTKPSHQ